MSVYDVLVIGGGAAGTAAALAASAAGRRRIALVTGGPGATALAAGGWSGPLPAPLAAALEAAGLPHTRVASAASEPANDSGRANGSPPTTDSRATPTDSPATPTDASTTPTDASTAPMDAPPPTSDAPPPTTAPTARLPHPSGDLRAYEYAAATHAPAAELDGALVCGIAGLPSFRAAPLARVWGAAAGADVAATTLTLPDTPRRGWSPVALAAASGRSPAALADAVADAVKEHGARRVVLPAVLGIERPDRVITEIEAVAGVPVAEALGEPPSVPGWRLDRALAGALEAAGVTVVRGRVRARETSGGHVHWVEVETASKDGDDEPARATRADDASAGGGPPVRLEAREFVLATGKFLGGGVSDADGRLVEPALACPVWIERLDEVIEESAPLASTAPDRDARQPLLEAGVRTDAEARPVDRWGAVVYTNVRVAGSVRAGMETGELGLGRAAADGWRAGELAAGQEAGR